MTDLVFRAARLDELAGQHEAATKSLDEAVKAPAGIGQSVWLGHGVICAPANVAVVAIESVRKTASERVASLSADLAEKLRTASGAYVSIDKQAVRNLDEQVRTS